VLFSPDGILGLWSRWRDSLMRPQQAAPVGKTGAP
jgi:hypothetical protein